MDNDTEQLIKQQIEKLPPEIQKVLRDTDWQSKMLAIGKKYSLHIDQLDTFQMETMLTLIGLTHPDEYVTELKSRLGVSENLAQALALEVNEQIMKSIRSQLIDVYNTPETIKQNVSPLATAKTPENLTPSENTVLKESEIELEPVKKEVTPTVVADRSGLLNAMENPPKSQPISLNDIPKTGGQSIVQKNIPQPTPPVPAPTVVSSMPLNPIAPQTPPRPVGSLVAEKLNGASSIPPTQSTYEQKKQSVVVQQSTDPYREPIETPPSGSL